MRTMRTMRRWKRISGVSLAFLLASAVSGAFASGDVDSAPGDLPAPSGEVLLIIDGAIQRVNNSGQAHFDMAMIETLPGHRLHTSTAVTDGVRQFDGFLMRDLLDFVGAHGTLVEAKALNHYNVAIPMTDFHQYDVLLATHMDGVRLQPSGKGPFWIVYPRDDWRQLQDIRYDYRWVWQLNHLTVK